MDSNLNLLVKKGKNPFDLNETRF